MEDGQERSSDLFTLVSYLLHLLRVLRASVFDLSNGPGLADRNCFVGLML